MTIYGIPEKTIKIIARGVPSFLTKRELVEYQTIRVNKKNDWIAGRVALKLAYQSVNPEITLLKKIPVDHYKNGQPYITKDRRFFCSISHSSSYGVGAISSYAIGIDIEKIQVRKKELLKFVALEEEVNLLSKYYVTNKELLTALWTIKEAVMKAIGTGFLVKPKDVLIQKKQKDTFIVKVLKNKYTNSSMWKVETKKYENFYISIAYPKSIRNNGKIINRINFLSIPTTK